MSSPLSAASKVSAPVLALEGQGPALDELDEEEEAALSTTCGRFRETLRNLGGLSASSALKQETTTSVRIVVKTRSAALPHSWPSGGGK